MYHRIYFILSSVLFFNVIVGCQSDTTLNEEPFLISYSHDTIHHENKDEINKWLIEVKDQSEVKIHSNRTIPGYKYFYAKGYNDVFVTFQRYLKNDGESSLIKANFKKGNLEDEVFIEVKYNPSLCCDSTVIDDSYDGE
ncbi:hypothetical protein [Alkalihalobacterium elongatum]|uniref:hypothetical protein n=1 Tax=Alkalihalobacterium elongatum TaxID=2675466 RepID=UPI001C1FF54F|nr:hypothetical protein [Alkalihalobacterium elongatum]